MTLNYLKNAVDARTLSNPRVRTVDGQPAKIHVGDRVPLQSASIQDATGQSRTMYEYHDIGIALDVIPKYHLDDSIFVDLNVEVSSLGPNLGTQAAPAYAIRTRNVHTTMILREAETAVLGGLISETEQHSLNGLPIPGVDPNGILGHLFSNHGDKAQRTELILTITPYLVRSQSLPRRNNTDFYSGTEKDYSTRTSYDYLNRSPPAKQPPRYMLTPDNKKPVDEAATKGRPPGRVADNWLREVMLSKVFRARQQIAGGVITEGRSSIRDRNTLYFLIFYDPGSTLRLAGTKYSSEASAIRWILGAACANSV